MKFIIIAGCQRSGTTLTGQIVGTHSKTFLIDEPDGLYAWFDAWITQRWNFEDISARTIKKAASKYTDHRQSFSQLKSLDAMSIVLKAPNLTYRYEELSRLIPRPKILYPVRDIRAVAASMMKLTHIKMIENQIGHLRAQPAVADLYTDELRILQDPSVSKITKFAVVWKIKTGLYNKYVGAGLNPYVFRYEDLVNEPDFNSQKMMDSCGLKYESTQLNYHEVLKGVGPGNTARGRRIDRSSLDKWRGYLSQNNVDKIVGVGKALMAEIGYCLQ